MSRFDQYLDNYTPQIPTGLGYWAKDFIDSVNVVNTAIASQNPTEIVKAYTKLVLSIPQVNLENDATVQKAVNEVAKYQYRVTPQLLQEFFKAVETYQTKRGGNTFLDSIARSFSNVFTGGALNQQLAQNAYSQLDASAFQSAPPQPMQAGIFGIKTEYILAGASAFAFISLLMMGYKEQQKMNSKNSKK